jgi:hypothetical protein
MKNTTYLFLIFLCINTLHSNENSINYHSFADSRIFSENNIQQLTSSSLRLPYKPIIYSQVTSPSLFIRSLNAHSTNTPRFQSIISSQNIALFNILSNAKPEEFYSVIQSFNKSIPYREIHLTNYEVTLPSDLFSQEYFTQDPTLITEILFLGNYKSYP